MLSLTLLSIAAFVGSSIFKSYQNKANDEFNATSVSSQQNTTENNGDCINPVKHITITYEEEIVYNELYTFLQNLKNIGTDDVVYKLRYIANDVKSIYLKLGLISISQEYVSLKLMEFLTDRFNKFVSKEKEGNTLTKEFEIVYQYLEFSMRNTAPKDLIAYYIFDNFTKNNDKGSIQEINNEYKQEFESLFIPIITSKQNKKRKDFKIDKSNTKDNIIENYFQLLSKCGKIYKGIIKFYKNYGISINESSYNHEITYDLASTILEISDFYFTHNMTPEQLAHDITNHNIHFIHHERPEALDGESPDHFMSRLMANYFLNREIKNYYYFLMMCARAYYALKKNWECKPPKLYKNISELSKFNEQSLKLIYQSVKSQNYPFLDGLTENDVTRHILLTDPEMNI